ncbi:unannotated protein [freshwater metagenome]|jgi:Na+/melibiose symporter-like transporter|uniref:Unannotated protein n=1 Tax=freshwater metagenome TaxID=449393 RepID=A0A6J6STN9_9ZZZZ|nr:hypothetical protein [Actinomycetota bacterium]MSY45776.1 hypothetical protein [Actinomycetota bacterium]
MMRRLIAFVGLGVAAILTLANPAGAQQLVDAGNQGDGSGGLAFVLMVLMVMGIWAALFFMDRIRRRRNAEEDSVN